MDNYCLQYRKEMYLQKKQKKKQTQKRERKDINEAEGVWIGQENRLNQAPHACNISIGDDKAKAKNPHKHHRDTSVRLAASDENNFVISGPVPANLSNATDWKR